MLNAIEVETTERGIDYELTPIHGTTPQRYQARVKSKPTDMVEDLCAAYVGFGMDDRIDSIGGNFNAR